MSQQTIKASDVERRVLVQRHKAAQQAEAAYILAQNMANDALTMFCEGKGIPMGASLVEITEDSVVLEVPEQKKPELVAS